MHDGKRYVLHTDGKVYELKANLLCEWWIQVDGRTVFLHDRKKVKTFDDYSDALHASNQFNVIEEMV